MSSSEYLFGGRREDEVPRTTDARNAHDVSRAVAARLGAPAAFWAVLMLMATEAVLFGSFIATYFYLHLRTAQWPPAGIPEPRVVVPLVLAGVLLLTSVPMQLGALAARAGRLGAARRFVLLALFVQCGYFAFEMHDFRDELDKFGPTSHAYGSIYYVLLGADHAHVFVGLLLSAWLLLKLARGLNGYRLNATIAVTWYWHFVNVMTLLVTATLVSGKFV